MLRSLDLILRAVESWGKVGGQERLGQLHFRKPTPAGHRTEKHRGLTVSTN